MSKTKPYVICHMGSTVDGRIITAHWGDDSGKYSKLYEQCHNSFNSQAWLVGRVTMEKDFTEGLEPKLPATAEAIERKPFIGNQNAKSFAIAIDQHGKLGWESNEIDGDHVVEVLLESVDDRYLAYLQSVSVSYVFAGKATLDLELALQQLNALFGIETLMLEGGGNINGSFLDAGLIDELSLLILPLADGISGTPTIFEITNPISKAAKTLKLKQVEQLEHDVIWLRYQLNN